MFIIIAVTHQSQGVCPKGSDLENIVEAEPSMFLQDKDNMNMLSAFVVMFSFHAAPTKDKLKKQLSEVRFKTHQDNVDSGVDPEDLEHPCIADFLTSTDIAYTMSL